MRQQEKEIAEIGFEESRKPIGTLQFAACLGLVKVAESLLQQDEDPDKTRGTYITPLHWAVMNRHNDMLRFLLNRGADPNRQHDGLRFLRWIANHTCNIYLLPLGMAVSMDNVEAIECLLQQGANVNERMRPPSAGKTALSLALGLCRARIVKILLASGADLNIDAKGQMKFLTLELRRVVVTTGASWKNIQESLVGAAYDGDVDKVAFLLQHGANVDGTNGLTFPCDPDDENIDAFTCLTPKSSPEYSLFASPEYNFYYHNKQFIVDAPLVRTIHRRRGRRWLDHPSVPSACREPGCLNCFFLLLDSGANANIVCERTYRYTDDIIVFPKFNIPTIGRTTTPLFTASYYGYLDMIQALIGRGADVDYVLEVQGERCNALTSAIHSESFESSGNSSSSSLLVKETLHLLTKLGANSDLCEPKYRKRVEHLLQMSPQDCEQMARLQNVVKQPRAGFSKDESKQSFHDRRVALTELIHGGADLKLCCERDQRAIEELMSWSDEETRCFDEEREKRVTKYTRFYT
jgi:ankyrin repeat protein